MAIFCCEDPDARGAQGQCDGRAHRQRHHHAPYHGVQLHPRDCRAAFIEFNHTDGSDDVLGTYPPAGPDWQKYIRKDTTLALTDVEMQSPDPQALAEHWGKIIGVAVTKGDGGPMLKLPNATFRFREGAGRSDDGAVVPRGGCRQGARGREGEGLQGRGTMRSICAG